MSPAPRRYDLPAGKYPLTIEALHPTTRAVVWSLIVDRPDDTAGVFIPPLRRQFGHPVLMRIRFADGTSGQSRTS